MFALTESLLRSPLQTFLDQLETFNDHNLEGFVDTYAEHAVIHGLLDQPLVGREAIRDFYANRFNDESLRCTVKESLVFDDRWVVAHEIVWRADSQTRTVAMFEVLGGRISRAMLMKAEAPV